MCLRSGRDLETAEAGCFRVSRLIAAGLNLRGNQDRRRRGRILCAGRLKVKNISKTAT
jgi:hypothetical protein